MNSKFVFESAIPVSVTCGRDEPFKLDTMIHPLPYPNKYISCNFTNPKYTFISGK